MLQKLRHIYHHGTHKYPDLHRYTDIEPEAKLRVTYDDGRTIEDAPNELRAQAVTTNIQRLVARNKTDIDDLLAESAWYGRAADLPASAWTSDEIAGPNISDKSTVITFAKMAANAYVQTRLDGAWLPVKGGFNYTDDFGWQTDGLRGHIFADESNSTVVIGLKGTSIRLLHSASARCLMFQQELLLLYSMVPIPQATTSSMTTSLDLAAVAKADNICGSRSATA